MIPHRLAILLLTAAPLLGQQVPRVLDAKIHHLGDSRVDWPESDPDPEGLELRVAFQAVPNRHEYCLLIRHANVGNRWPILLNGKSLGDLRRGDPLQEHIYLVPAGALQEGRNELFFKCDNKADDILLGAIRLIPKTQREHLKLQPVEVHVADLRGRPLPAKVTITDAAGKILVPLFYASGPHQAARDGVVYTSKGVARFEVPSGEYRVYASRGMEWGVDERRIEVRAGVRKAIRLKIGREVDTTGFVSSDAHIHTLTFSGHGDASVEERVVTLAGEGIELAISTDHNHNTDYRPTQKKLDLTEHFTSVVGNEVTTKNGHFNGFPLDPDEPVPEYKLTDWVKVVDGMRAKGAKVVILCHPRWPQIMTTSPFGKQHFELNRISGQRARGSEFNFDAMELANSGAPLANPLFLFVDWFALLNHGERIMAVGTSDSHTVGDPVGQGRTYLRSSTDDPAKIDVDAACAAYREGRSSVSQGLFVDVYVGNRSMGDTFTVRGDTVPVSLRVACASWARANRARIYLNGRLVADREIGATDATNAEARRPQNETVFFAIPKPKNDAHLVCVVTGPGIPGRFWRARSTANYVLGATNPIFLDVDGDRNYESPRHQALRILREHGIEPERLAVPIAAVDDAVAVQLLGALLDSYRRLAGGDEKSRAAGFDLVRTLAASMPDRPVLARYVQSIRD